MHPAALAAFQDELEKIAYRNVASRLVAKPKMPGGSRPSFGGRGGTSIRMSKPRMNTASSAFKAFGQTPTAPKMPGMPDMPKPPKVKLPKM